MTLGPRPQEAIGSAAGRELRTHRRPIAGVDETVAPLETENLHELGKTPYLPISDAGELFLVRNAHLHVSVDHAQTSQKIPFVNESLIQSHL